MSQISIQWSVTNMTRVLSDGFVLQVDWMCLASAPNVRGALDGGVSTFEFDPSQSGFIPYEQLTQDIVLGWVFSELGDKKAEIETTLTAKVEKQITPEVAQGLPWTTGPVA